MLIPTILRRFAFLAPALLLATAHAADGPAEPPAIPLEVEVIPSKEVYGLLEPVDVKVRITSRLEHDWEVQVDEFADLRPYRLAVRRRGADGRADAAASTSAESEAEALSRRAARRTHRPIVRGGKHLYPGHPADFFSVANLVCDMTVPGEYTIEAVPIDPLEDDRPPARFIRSTAARVIVGPRPVEKGSSSVPEAATRPAASAAQGGPVEVELRVARTWFNRFEPISVKAKVRNRGDRAIWLQPGPASEPYGLGLEVLHAPFRGFEQRHRGSRWERRPEVLGPPRAEETRRTAFAAQDGPADGSAVEIAPGGEFVVGCYLNVVRDMTRSGEYDVSATLPYWESADAGPEGPKLVRSGNLALTIDAYVEGRPWPAAAIGIGGGGSRP